MITICDWVCKNRAYLYITSGLFFELQLTSYNYLSAKATLLKILKCVEISYKLSSYHIPEFYKWALSSEP